MTTGVAAVDFDGSARWTPLRSPTLREWCDWLDEWHATQPAADALTSAWAIEQASLDARVIRLTRSVLEAVVPPQAASSVAFVPALALASRATLLRLLDFWRDTPASPWDQVNLDRVPSDRRGRPIRSDFDQPGRALLSMTYRALRSTGVTPDEADGLELWQVASLLGVDDPDRGLDFDAGSEVDERGSRVVKRRIGDTTHTTAMSWRRPEGRPLLFTRRPISSVG